MGHLFRDPAVYPEVIGCASRNGGSTDGVPHWRPHPRIEKDSTTGDLIVYPVQYLPRDRTEDRVTPGWWATDPGDPSAWVVNEKPAYRQCAGCGSTVIADDRSRMNREWTPAWTFYHRRGRHGTHDTAPGPHAPGTYACTECRAGTPAL